MHQILDSAQLLAQVTPTPGSTLTYANPQFLVSIIGGLLLAFSFQFLFTNLSVVAGISLLGQAGKGKTEEPADANKSQPSLGGAVQMIGAGVGLWTLFTVSLSLFFASFLAVKLSLAGRWDLGAILGLVIWSAFFSLLLWASSNTLGSLVGSLVSSATAGIQAVISTAALAFGGKAVSNQVVDTAEAAAAAVKRELTSGFEPEAIRKTITEYVGKLPSSDLDLSALKSEFERLVNNPELKNASAADLGKIGRDTFVNLVGRYSQLKANDLEKVVDQLESVWNKTIKDGQPADLTAQLVEFAKNAAPEQLRSGKLLETAEAALKNLQQPAKEGGSLTDQALQLGYSTLSAVILGRADLSDLDTEKVLAQAQQLRDRLAGTVGKAQALLPNTIRNDVESYLLNAYPWQLNPQTIARDLPEIFYDPEASPAAIRQSLVRISREDFVTLLTQRALPADQLAAIADALEQVRVETLASVKTKEINQRINELEPRLIQYLQTTARAEFTLQGLNQNFKALLVKVGLGSELQREGLNKFDQDFFLNLLNGRQDFSPEERTALATQLVSIRDLVIQEADSAQVQTLAGQVVGQTQVQVGEAAEQVKEQYNNLTAKFAEYLRKANSKVPEGGAAEVKADLEKNLADSQAELAGLTEQLGSLDRETLTKQLSQDPTLTPEQVNTLADQGQELIRKAAQFPRRFAQRSKEKVQDFQVNLENYLRDTNKEALNPEGIKRDLSLLLQDPKGGWEKVSERLGHLDRATLASLLSQRDDLSEDEAYRIVDQVLISRDQLSAQVQKLQTQVQDILDGIFGQLRSYLNGLNRPELNYEGIQHDLQMLLTDSQAGVEALRERFAHIDRDTLVALVGSRPDISKQEADRLVSQVENVRDTLLNKAEEIQTETQRRLEELKHQAQEQAESARKAAATASWWLLGTAVISAAVSAIGGALAVTSL